MLFVKLKKGDGLFISNNKEFARLYVSDLSKTWITMKWKSKISEVKIAIKTDTSFSEPRFTGGQVAGYPVIFSVFKATPNYVTLGVDTSNTDIKVYRKEQNERTQERKNQAQQYGQVHHVSYN